MTIMKSIMLQGTSSDVGKSVLCTAFCRIFREDGYRVAPFKSQNMALNSYITLDGGEIGRSQGVQAEACNIEATVDMNPILLKPKQDMVAEIIVHGKRFADAEAGEYRDRYVELLIPYVQESLKRLADEYQVLVIEGAGSPAEINLKDRDIANMRVAELADAPVILVADIDRGGVFASLVGTLQLLNEEERRRVKGFIINKFRGKRSILDPGLEWLETFTGIPVLGVIPYAETNIEAEDSLALSSLRLKRQDESGQTLDIGVIRLPYISNFTDIDPLYDEPGVRVRFISSVTDWKDPDITIIPGTKNTTDDLEWLKKSGLDRCIYEAGKSGSYVVGICGGYQMLGQTLYDPDGIESQHKIMKGLALLPVETRFLPDKSTVRTEGIVCGATFAADQRISGYEIHLGQSEPVNDTLPLFQLQNGRMDGAITEDNRIWGTYLHGIFHNRMFTRSWLNHIREEKGMMIVTDEIMTEKELREKNYAALSRLVSENVNLEKIYDMMGLKK